MLLLISAAWMSDRVDNYCLLGQSSGKHGVHSHMVFTATARMWPCASRLVTHLLSTRSHKTSWLLCAHFLRISKDFTLECATRHMGDSMMQKLFIHGSLIRKLWSVETHAYRDHLLRLDPGSRRNRFNGTIADDTVRGYAATARGSDVILHGFFVDGVLRGVADLRILGREAEAAFSIEKPWQSRSVGSALLERSLLAARNRGATLLQVCCLVDNYRMRKLARKYRAELIFDCGTVTGTMENPQPTPLSLMRQVWKDPHRGISCVSLAPSAILEVSSDDDRKRQAGAILLAPGPQRQRRRRPDLFGSSDLPNQLRFGKGLKPFRNGFSNCDSRRRWSCPLGYPLGVRLHPMSEGSACLRTQSPGLPSFQPFRSSHKEP